MTKIFKFCGNAAHNLRSGQVIDIIERRHNRTNNFGAESKSTLGTKIWALVQHHSTVSSNVLKG